ncbi:MAG TPA: substrate-binding domain-containing protein [Solirubrobacterales bacterium]
MTLALAFALSACGGSDSSSSGGETAASTEGGEGTSAPAKNEESSAEIGEPEGNLEVVPEGTEQLCGEEPTKVALVDGFGGNSWRKIVRAELEDELSVCDNVEVSYAQADGEVQKYNSEINSYTAQGYNIILTYDDFGEETLSALRTAFQSGVVVVPYIAEVGGTAGTDFTAQIEKDVPTAGTELAEWMNKQLNGKGNVLMLGGSAGNPNSQAWIEAEMAASAPGINWLQETPVTTNWDPAMYQRVTTGLISKYPELEGVFSDYGAGYASGVRAYIAAGKEHPPLATSSSSNELFCLWQEQKKNWPNFQMISIDGDVRVVRWAARRALAELNEIPLSDPTTLKMFKDVDTVAGKDPECDKNLPPDADLSSALSKEQLEELFQ